MSDALLEGGSRERVEDPIVSRMTQSPGTPLRAILLDFDGTLAYMEPSHWATYAEAARAEGLVLSEAALAAPSVDRAWDRWMTPQGVAHPDASISEAAFRAVRVEIALSRMRAGLDTGAHVDETALRRAAERAADLEAEPARYRLYADVRPALARITEAGARAIVVSNHLWRLPEIVEALGLGDAVAGVVTSARCGYRKPHPAIYRAALDLAGTAPDATLMVGDSLSADVRGAEGAGLHAVLLDRDRTGGASPEGVHAIRSLLEVPLVWPPA
ncbi:MAG: HAD family hydrolase [Dehalococcoidia bacterium]|nr:HAD family hydrolase [Dehalococcoidia bacterium]